MKSLFFHWLFGSSQFYGISNTCMNRKSLNSEKITIYNYDSNAHMLHLAATKHAPIYLLPVIYTHKNQMMIWVEGTELIEKKDRGSPTFSMIWL